MKRIDSGTVVLLTLSAVLTSLATEFRAPGRPRLTSCRSPEKETFTCWWEPGDDGGLPTTHALYYRLENSETLHECPDYKTTGENSCFFSKNDTSLWVNYNITVVASNAMGRSVSEPVEVDVVYIVQPNTPENVVVVVVEGHHGPYLRVSWDKPQTADTRSGWITLVYELRIKQIQDNFWEELNAGMQKHYNIFSLHSGKEYMIQVRCRPDHGFWSEWAAPVYIQMPDYMPREEQSERPIWIMVAIFSAFIFLILTLMLSVNRNSVKHCLLPPVPGPKIKGFDQQLLKSGKSEEMFNSFVIQGFPPTKTYEDLLVEYLEVYDEDKQELVLDGSGHNQGTMKSKITSDSDSGRGSCDSRTLLLDKCATGSEESGTELEVSQYGEASWVSTDSGEGRDTEPTSPGLEDGKLQTWRVVFSSSESPQHQYHIVQQQVEGVRTAFHGTPEIPSALMPYNQQTLEEIRFGKPQVYHNMDNAERNKDVAGPQSNSNEYVEVQTVNQENILLLRPLTYPDGHDPNAPDFAEEDYSKVRDVTSDNVLLLQRNLIGPQRVDEYCQNRDGTDDPCHTQLQEQGPGCKIITHHSSSFLSQDCMRLAMNGYVDSAVMLS